MKKRNLWLDLFKLVLAWMVICIHCLGETYDYHPIYRLAVPMFFAISGYYAYRKEGQLSGAAAMIRRSFRYMCIGFGFYIIFDFVMCYVNGSGVGYYFTTLFYENILFDFFFLNRPITYTGAQLWFLIALFVVSLAHWTLVRFRKMHWYPCIVLVGLAIQLFFGGYMRLFQETDMPIRYTRNAWFMGLPFFGMGYLMAQVNFHKKSCYKFMYLALGVFFTFLQIQEHALVQAEVYASTVPATAFMLLFFTGLKSPRADFYYRWFGKDMSYYVYVLHLAVSVILGKFVTYPSPLAKSLYILIACILIYETVFLLRKAMRCLRP